MSSYVRQQKGKKERKYIEVKLIQIIFIFIMEENCCVLKSKIKICKPVTLNISSKSHVT